MRHPKEVGGIQKREADIAKLSHLLDPRETSMRLINGISSYWLAQAETGGEESIGK